MGESDVISSILSISKLSQAVQPTTTESKLAWWVFVIVLDSRDNIWVSLSICVSPDQLISLKLMFKSNQNVYSKYEQCYKMTSNVILKKQQWTTKEYHGCVYLRLIG